MTITFQCEHCHKQVQAPDAAAGKRGKCPHCGHSSYIPAPVADEDVLDLAPIDEAEERARKEKIHNLLEQEEKLLQETGGAEPPPLEHRENLSAADLHHFVVNYCLDLSQSNLARAEKHAAELKKFGPLGLEAVSDFVTGKALEPALDPIPVKVLQAFLTDLRDKLHA
ncbi:MAG TPA: RNHCP domain-containing protein [Phycisphaerae bacterium]|nr:RNHCP domain-containing protein [Phycisphaerae bacterium]